MNVSTDVTVNINKLNEDIQAFPQVHPITADMSLTHMGVSRLVMLDRYAFKDTSKVTLSVGDLVVLTVKPDPSYPTRGTGFVTQINYENHTAQILIEEEYRGAIENPDEQETGIVTRDLDAIEKPLEIYYEQIAKRNATGLAAVEKTAEQREASYHRFYNELAKLNFIPAGRVLYGAGSDTEVTYFNCYVMPFVPDSRGGISDHRKKIMEIM
ncbi:ribonucleotide reductase N-terminal alpha domain-containing protein, partial [Carnobacterium sp.]|uniref:ribonucleotide reductase N-terminal alpha domain-containing protein n=1 Tax=Carnobacterium sp. TaxID=48221 RepID=UPI0037BED4E0